MQKKYILNKKLFYSHLSSEQLHVAITFNVKPEHITSIESVSPSAQHSENTPLQPDYDDRYAEWDTWETIHAVRDALAARYKVTLIEADNTVMQRLREIQPDLVFNIAEGLHGISREAQVPAILDMLDIPYSGSDPLTLATCLDKARTKEILTYHQIPNAKFFLAHGLADCADHGLLFPLVVKPVAEGSGKGIFASSFVRNETELLREVTRVNTEYGQGALVEEFLEGKEFTVAILGNGEEARVLPIIEISFHDFPSDFVPMYSYEAKWVLDSKEHQLDIYQCPARISTELEQKIQDVCLRAYKVLNCRDWSRIDLRLDAEGNPRIIEINPLPGILPDPKDNSCYPKAARTAGIEYNEMLLAVCEAACKRYGLC